MFREALVDPEPRVRRRACELAAGHPDVSLLEALADGEPLVAEAAAWALGEHGDTVGTRRAEAALAWQSFTASTPNRWSAKPRSPLSARSATRGSSGDPPCHR